MLRERAANSDQCLQVVLARAEALAKAQFALKRDPHDCALMYLALKKKQLLMVRNAAGPFKTNM